MSALKFLFCKFSLCHILLLKKPSLLAQAISQIYGLGQKANLDSETK